MGKGTSGSYAHIGERMGLAGGTGNEATGTLMAPSSREQASKVKGGAVSNNTRETPSGKAPKGMKMSKNGDDT